MIDIFRLHWRLIKNPTNEIKKNISKFPLSLGVSLYILYLLRGYFQSGDSYRMLYDILVTVYNFQSEFSLYIYIILTVSYTLVIYYFIMPLFVRWFSGQTKNEFNRTLYQKLIFYSPTAFVIFTVSVLLPLQVLLQILILIYDFDLLLIIFGLFYSLLSLWTIVLIVNIFIIQWKGLKIFYNIEGIKRFLLIFIIPIIGFIPMLIIYGQRIIDYLKNMAA